MSTPQPFDANAAQNPYPQPEPAKQKKKKWPWIVGIVAVLVIAGAMSGGDSDDTTTASTTSSENEVTEEVAIAADDAEAAVPVEEVAPVEEPVVEEEPDAATDIMIGESADSNGMITTVSNLRFASDILGTYVCADVALSNESDSAKRFSQFDFELHRPNGVIANTTFTALEVKDLEMAELAPGGATDGTVCFDTDGTPGEYKVEYSGSGFFSTPLTWTATL